MRSQRIKNTSIPTYKVTDEKGTFIIRKVECGWIANECSNKDDCTDLNSWAVCFKTKRELLKYAKSF